MPNLNTINQQARLLVDEVNQSIQYQSEVTQEQTEQLAQTIQRKRTSQASTTRKIEKDIIAAKTGAPASSKKIVPNTQRLELPEPIPLIFNLHNRPEMGLIAIMSEVLCMQIRSNSNFYSTLFKQSTEEMIANVKLVPLTAEATKLAFFNQSKATQMQAEISKSEGMAMFIAFVPTLVMAAGSDMFDENNSLNKNKNPFTIEGDNPDQDSLNEFKSLNPNKDFNDNLNNLVNKDNAVASNSKKAIRTLMGKGGNLFKKAMNGLMKGLQTSNGAVQGADAAVKAFVLPGKQNAMALYQKTEGEFQALAKQTEGYGQFYNQNSQQSWQLLQGTEQNINSTVSTLQQAGNTLGQASARIFS